MLPKKILYILARYSLDLFRVLLYNKDFYAYYMKRRDLYLTSMSQKYVSSYENFSFLPSGIVHGTYNGYTIIKNTDEKRRILSEEKHYYLGRLHGISKTYRLNSRIYNLSHYSHGKLHGACILYKSNGKIKSISIYNKNTLISSNKNGEVLQSGRNISN